MTSFSAEIKRPTNLEEGLQNFVQMIINRLEAGDTHYALLLAVDLHDDLCSKSNPYKEVLKPDTTRQSVPQDEHFAALETAKSEALERGIKLGRRAMQREISEKLAEAA